MFWLKQPLIFLTVMIVTMTHGFSQTDLFDLTLEASSPKGEVNLNHAYGGQVALIVNTASGCGYTPQYETLQKLYDKYRDQGFVILGFPSNDFFQEAKEDESIVTFCRINYGVNFPLFKKSSVKGDNANQLYQRLIERYGQAPQWNFFKYLVDHEQNIVGFYTPQDVPLGGVLEEDIKGLLKKNALNDS